MAFLFSQQLECEGMNTCRGCALNISGCGQSAICIVRDVTPRPALQVWGPPSKRRAGFPLKRGYDHGGEQWADSDPTEAVAKDTGRGGPHAAQLQFLPTSPSPGPLGYVCCSIGYKGFMVFCPTDLEL